MADARLVPAVFAVSLLGSLAACGQKGPLYLPDQAREVVTRPTQTPAPAPDAQSPNSPQTVDSPEGPANPAPEVTAPDNDDNKDGNSDKDKKEPDSTAPR
jgi:predicted small lipoprotein YifL